MATDHGAPVPIPANLAEDWDTSTIVTAHPEVRPLADADRRHSGWEAVERQWIVQQEQISSRTQVEPQTQGWNWKQSSEINSGKSGTWSREDHERLEKFPYPNISVPRPNLDSDFRMRVTLNTRSASMATGDGFKKWTTVADGVWSGHLGHGIVVSGGQESRDLAHGQMMATQVEATHRLKTGDEPPAYIDCKTRGFKTGPLDVMKTLQNPDTTDQVDPRLCQYRVFITMKTADDRYVEKVNFGMWVGSCVWKGLEVVCDAYRVT
ncbi:hypothetical protein F5Y15DRAFT_418272 [Xylariaceae sp. FL0016]|nr:hypothetical protein F5Y15DRAFT_418272 [Xylariaceae sp. FL0016]